MRFVVTILFVVLCSQFVFSQDKPDRPDRELLAKLLGGSIQFSEVDEVLLQFNDAFREDPSRSRLSQGREMLVDALVHQQRFDEAVKFLKEGFDYRQREFDTTGDGKHLSIMHSFSRQMSEIAPRSSQSGIESEMLDMVIERLRQELASSDELNMNWRWLMISLDLRCRTLPPDTAKALLDDEFEKARQLLSDNPENRFAVLGYLDALKSKAIPPYPGGKPEIKHVRELLKYVTELQEGKALHKTVWGIAFYDTCQFVVDKTMHPYPAEADVFASDAIAILEKAGEDDTGFERMFDFRIKNLESSKKRIASSRKFVGKSVPDFNAIGWVNGVPIEREELKGRVVLLDFTAVWCGPCIQQFPDLKMLHRKYSDEGLVIISVTNPYNYVWNEATESPTKSKKNVELEDELEMLKKFVARHELPFRLMVVERGSELGESLGVASIPHAVVVDQTGVVRLVGRGNTEANSAAIQSKIRELLSD